MQLQNDNRVTGYTFIEPYRLLCYNDLSILDYFVYKLISNLSNSNYSNIIILIVVAGGIAVEKVKKFVRF